MPAQMAASKRKRNSVTVASAIASSPDSDHDDDVADHPEKKRQPGVKRACNECRQQKVSHRASRPHRSTAMLNVLLGLSAGSFDAMSYRNPSEAARGVTASSSNARSSQILSASASDPSMPRWRRRLRGCSMPSSGPRRRAISWREDEEMPSQLQSPLVNSVYTHTRKPLLDGLG